MENIECRPSRDGKNCTYRVHIAYVVDGRMYKYAKSFSSKKYGSRKMALEMAKDDRDRKRLEISRLSSAPQECSLDRLMNLKEATIQHTKRTNDLHRLYYRSFIKPVVQDTNIKDITAVHIQTTLNNMVKDKSQDTIERVFSIWKQLYKTAIIHDLCDRDLTMKVVLPKSDKIRSVRKKTTSYEDMELVCESIRKHLEDREVSALIDCALHIMYFTGLRPQEVYALSRSNIDRERRIIEVKTSVGSNSSQERVIVRTKTPNSIRKVFYPSELDSVFDDLFSRDKEYLFETRKGILSGDFTSDIIRRYRPVEFRQYNLRHQFSSDLIENGVDIRTIQELMGHASPDMSVNYARSKDENKRKAIETRSALK